MNVALISANLGAYEDETRWPPQVAPGLTVVEHRLGDHNFPPRRLAMTSRLQAGIPKWWGWQMYPGYDAYVWIDASCTPTATAAAWFVERLGSAEIAVFQHPERRTIRAEYEFITHRMLRPGETYLNSRYCGEWLREQYAYIAADSTYRDEHLYASTAFVYRSVPRVTAALQAVWSAKARWLLHDQLMFPYALHTHGCDVAVIPDNYLKCPALTFTRRTR